MNEQNEVVALQGNFVLNDAVVRNADASEPRTEGADATDHNRALQPCHNPCDKWASNEVYDDTVAANCNVATLATAFSNRSVYLLDRRVGLHTGKAELPLVPVESDPTKAKPSDLLQPPGGGPRDLPADEKQEMCRALVS